MSETVRDVNVASSSPGNALAFPSLLPLPRTSFRPLSDSDVHSARLLAPGDSLPRKGASRASPAQRSGIRYQRKVCDHLRLFCEGEEFLVAPWIAYRLGKYGVAGSLIDHYCQPDALLVRPDFVLVFEIKYSFTTDAWWQLEHLYRPVVTHLYQPKRPVLVNVVRSYDPDIKFPGEAWPLHFDFDWLRDSASEASVVVQWRP